MSKPSAPSRFRTRIATPLALALAVGAPGAKAQAQAAPVQGTQTAQAAARDYRIPAGPLAVVLSQFASQAGVVLSVDARLTDGKQSPGVAGAATVAEGFQRALAGTGLQVRQTANGIYTLEHAPAPATELPAVSVLGSQPRDTYSPPAVAGISHSDIPVMDQPQAVNVVPAQALRDQQPRNLDDALANVSGITQGNTLAGTQDTIMKRGFGDNRDGSIMRNGMPVIQGRALNATADRVEVLKGPASLTYGIMDPGGVINVESKRPELDSYHSISLEGSTYGSGKNGSGATLDFTGGVGNSRLAYRLIADYVDEDYWRNFGKHREGLVAPSLAWYGDDTQIVFSYEHRNFLYPFDRGTALDPRTNQPLSIPATRRLDAYANKMKGESDLAQLQIDHRFNRDWKAHFGYSYNREIYDANQMRITGVNTATGTLSRSNDGTWGANSKDSFFIGYLDGNANIAGMRNNVQLGSSLEYRTIYRRDLLRQKTVCTFSYLHPDYDCEPAPTTISPSDSNQTDRLRDFAFWLQDSLYLTDKWILVAGLRYQHWDQLAGRGTPFHANTDTSDDKVLPRFGLVYKWNDALSLYGSYTESLKPTSTIAPLSSGAVVDSSIAPEQAKSWELGVKWDVAEGLSGTLAFFDIRKRNVLVSQFNDETKLTDWRTSGAARSRGVELDVSGKLTDRWNVIGSYAFIDARTTEDPVYSGNRLWNVAEHTASLYAVYDAGQFIPGGKTRVGAGAHYVGSRPGDSANSFELPAYTVFNAFASYDTKIAGRNVNFQLNVNNLFNRVYYPSSANQYFVALGDGRQVMLRTTVEF
ncbi:TonB-dependent siderophore receptor [Achromobacter aloeverae]